MRLEIGNFYVKDIKFGDKLSFDDGVLTINKGKALDFIREDERITEADLYIAKPGDKILDTHLGSGSSRIAAYDAGLDFVGCEIDKDYFAAQEERFAAHTAQLSLFV